MSRAIVFDLNNQAVGEFPVTANRGYVLYGNPAVSGEPSIKITIPENVATQPWLQFGRLVLVQGNNMPAWAGVIDPPWQAQPPVTLTLYSAEYLFSLRVPDVVNLPIAAGAVDVIRTMIALANEQMELFVRLGETSQVDNVARQEVITQKKLWEQIRAFAERSGTELVLRPERDGEHLIVNVDIGVQGRETGMLLQDGENIQITGAEVIGTLTNRLTGMSSQSTTASRITTEPFLAEELAGLYRLRSDVVQFRNLSDKGTLEKHTQRELEYVSRPRLQITGNIVLADAELANNVRVGNWFVVHAPKLLLPGGRRGWRGRMRIPKFFYNEKGNTANVTMEAFL